ncbi:MAG TPA: hypothetical protein VFQ38_23385 [Longimicrobiales bacterium]|nr:hypothetical protein [Longimicrobiales bacterium]
MDHHARRALAALVAPLALLAGACGDPLIVTGDPPAIMRVVAGIPDSAGATLDSLATRSRLRLPAGVAMDAEGILYIADSDASRVLAVTSAGRIREVRAETFCREALCLTRPSALAVDGQGALVVADPFLHQVVRLDPKTGGLTRVAGQGGSGSSPDGTPALQAQLQAPAGVAVGPDGRIYISERNGDRVRVVRADGTLGTAAGGDGSLARPAGLALADGVLYIADTDDHRVRAVRLATGDARTVAGTGVAGFSGDTGPAADAQLRSPVSVAVSSDGLTLYIGDAGNHRVRAVNLTTGMIGTFAGTGATAMGSAGRNAAETPIADPAALATSPLGFLVVADPDHRIVWRTTVRF